MGCCFACCKREGNVVVNHTYPREDPYGKKDYVGEMQNGRRHGFGLLRWNDDRVYEGHFCSDLAHGAGKFWFDPPRPGQPTESCPEHQFWSYGVRSYHGAVPFSEVSRDDLSRVDFLEKKRDPTEVRRMRLPFDYDIPRVLSSGAHGHFTAGDGEFAWDFGLPIGAPVLCAAAGHVLRFVDRFPEGRPTKEFRGKDNFVVVKHDDGTLGTYCHLHKGGIKVQKTQRVEVGDVLGISGNSGYSSGPHLHFHVASEADSHMFIQNPVVFYGALCSDDDLFFCDTANVCYGATGPISDRFDGNVDANGCKQGYGVLHRADGATYVGQFKDDEFHGTGKLTYGETDRLNFFEGSFDMGLRSGHGALEWADGRMYQGEWDGNLISGRGVLRYAPRDRFNRLQYDGEFYKDMRHGHGRLEWVDGNIFEGKWVNDSAPEMCQEQQAWINGKKSHGKKKK